MTIKLDDIMAALPTKRRAWVAVRAMALTTLKGLHKAAEQTPRKFSRNTWGGARHTSSPGKAQRHAALHAVPSCAKHGRQASVGSSIFQSPA